MISYTREVSLKLLLYFGLFVGIILPSFAQNKPYFAFFQQEYFFGHLPSPRAEAMGRTGVAIGGTASSFYYNPAGIGSIDQCECIFSTSGPFYALTNSDYHFIGYSRRINDIFVLGLSVNQLAVGRNSFSVNINGQRYQTDRPRVEDYTLSVAATPIDGLQVGVNAHVFSWKIFNDVSAIRSLYFDAGAIYTLKFYNAKRLQFGASLVNLFPRLTFLKLLPVRQTSANRQPIGD